MVEVIPDQDMNSQGEVDLPLQLNHQSNKNHLSSSTPALGRQSSIYSLTLDEFQHTILEGGKNFGSMNMDEFINSIWTAEENQAGHTVKQPSLPRQGSLTLPEKLCRKTVEEVWSEIHRSRQRDEATDMQNAGSLPRQSTFGEMTLEDFLVKAGVVRGQQQQGQGGGSSVAAAGPPQQYTSMYQNPVAYQSIGLGIPVPGFQANR